MYMNTGRRTRRDGEKGQALAIIAIMMTVLLAVGAMVVDGGNGMAQQRGTQNGADAAALAGAVVIAEKMGGQTVTDSDVSSAVSTAFVQNATDNSASYYVDYNNNVVGTVGRGGSIPSDAGGVQTGGARTFDTFLAGIMGMNTWTATAQATAMAGALRSVCSADDGCSVMPVTFSIPITTCDGSNRPLRIGVDWPLVGLDIARADTTGRYESIVPLCKNGPGGVGWLDMGCGTLRDSITTPCNSSFDIPTWLHTESGNVNNVESAVNAYSGNVILIPMFDATCRDVPNSGLPADCTDPGNGDNLYYHIPRFAQFLLDRAYIQGGNAASCNSTPGSPLVGGNGGTSCFKGWFVRYIRQGKVGNFQSCSEAGGTTDCLHEPILGVQLVK
jgi:hypothetical protein